ncbi:aldehyde dehydrogenase family protein [Pseudomonas silesiensis]
MNETFGPVAPLFHFNKEAQAIEMANDKYRGWPGGHPFFSNSFPD